MRTFQALERAPHHLVNGTGHPAIVRLPVILIFRSAAALAQWSHLPDFACHGMLASGFKEEVAPRMLGAVRKSGIAPLAQSNAALTLVPAPRTMIYENTNAGLTPADYMLFELLFFNKYRQHRLVKSAGADLSEERQIHLCKQHRVAKYQMHLKLDTLTPLNSIYRHSNYLRRRLMSKPLHIPLSTIGNRSRAQIAV